MSYGIHAFSVSLAEVRTAIGSKDAGLVDEIKEQFASHFEEDAADDADLDEDEDRLSLEDALRGLVDGAALLPAFGQKYGYAVELLCWHFGTFLPNDQFTGMRWQWVEDVDESLATVGIKEVQFGLAMHLLNRGSPIRIPPPDDFPSIGYLDRSEMEPILSALLAADLETLDSEVRGSIEQIIKWIEHCVSNNDDLVCFYY